MNRLKFNPLRSAHFLLDADYLDFFFGADFAFTGGDFLVTAEDFAFVAGAFLWVTTVDALA